MVPRSESSERQGLMQFGASPEQAEQAARAPFTFLLGGLYESIGRLSASWMWVEPDKRGARTTARLCRAARGCIAMAIRMAIRMAMRMAMRMA